MKKIAIVGVGTSALYARAVIEAERIAQESDSHVIVVGADGRFEMDTEEIRQKIMEVSHANTKLTLSKDDVIPLLAGEYYDDPVSLRTQNKPFYYGVPKSKKRGRKI